MSAVVFSLFCLGVFPVLLCSFGRGEFAVRFVFGWGLSVGSVECRVSSRSAAARLLWRFRAARLWWRRSCGSGVAAGSHVRALGLPRFGLRWLAARPCFIRAYVPRSRRCFFVAPGWLAKLSPFWACHEARSLGLC